MKRERFVTNAITAGRLPAHPVPSNAGVAFRKPCEACKATPTQQQLQTNAYLCAACFKIWLAQVKR